MRAAAVSRCGLIVTVGVALLPGVAGAQPPLRVPLRQGLTIVTAINDETKGDYESIKTIVRVTDKDVQLKYSSESPAAPADDNPLAAFLGGGTKQKPRNAEGQEVDRVNVTRTVSRQDLKVSHDYRQHFSNGAPDRYPGTTAIGLSAEALNELKTKGRTQLSVQAAGIVGALGSMLGGLLGGGSTRELDEATKLTGTLERVEPSAVPFKVLLNDQPVALPAIHARGQLGDEEAEFWILDDAENPLSLKWTIGEGTLQVIKLSFPPETTTAAGGGAGASSADAPGAPMSAARIERELEEVGRAVVYGIYFDFNSDRIKEESEPVLKEIATVMSDNPAWTLTVEGHTDSIGSTAANQTLSERRAASVRRALGDRYRIAATRLVPAGFGESRPKDTNDTLEGRALNRRVELARVK